ncbi:DUF1565 domain-containing protein [Desulfurobacterium sp.]
MATLEEVLAALDSATTDAREVLTKIPQIATTNGDVPFTFADGTQITLPGLPKLKAEVDGFIAGAETTIQSWWNRTLYVDAVNGDDSNPGTSDAPFKTIGKAIYTTPIGGYASIYLKEGQVHEITATNGIGINRKSIIFKRWGGQHVCSYKKNRTNGLSSSKFLCAHSCLYRYRMPKFCTKRSCTLECIF